MKVLFNICTDRSKLLNYLGMLSPMFPSSVVYLFCSRLTIYFHYGYGEYNWNGDYLKNQIISGKYGKGIHAGYDDDDYLFFRGLLMHDYVC